VTLHRVLSLGLAAGLAVAACPPASAQRDAAMDAVLAARAPLAVSGDGAWRLSVDSHDVLHRAGLADASRESTTQLPPGVQALAASADGRRVVLATTGQCIGRVDFDAATGNATSVAWRSAGGWAAQMPADCGTRAPAPPVAISSDGRWIAAPDAVVDAASGQGVASLPADAAHVLRLQFVDHDARLLVARVPRPDRLSLSVWDLAGKALVDDVETSASPALRLDVSAQTGAVFRVDRAAPFDSAAPLELARFAPGTCVAAPRVRARLSDDPGASFVVDPAGRWFASARPLDAQRHPDEWAAGQRSELVVQDIAGTRVLARTTSRFPLGGLVAAPDGGGVFAVALHTIDAIDAPADASAVDVDQLVHIDLPDAVMGAPRDLPGTFAPTFCHEPGEAPGARAAARSAHLLVPAWTHDLGADMAAAGPTDADACADAAARPTPFRTADGGLWFDLGAQVVRLDPATGAIVKSLPTPRRKGVCSVVAPTGTGFFNATGDTLTWRPLAAAVEAGRRRVLERRPGWVATLAPVRGDTVRVFWAHAATDGGSGVVAADYDANGRRLRETAVDAADTLADPAAPAPEPCHDARGTPIAIGYDWRAGPFGSQRGMTCGPLPGAARLIWWSGATLAPRAAAADATGRLAPAIDGAIGVSADATQLHVVNLALQREIAQVALGDVVAGQVWVLASRRLVLVQSTASDGHAGLRAYALP
jgi:hypothetical protein